MKKTIYQFANWHFMPLKLVGTLLLITIFSSVFGQVDDPQGFSTEKTRQEALKRGMHSDEVSTYIEAKRNNYYFEKRLRESGEARKNLATPLGFTRKSGNPACEGEFENGTVSPWHCWTGINDSGLYYYYFDSVYFVPGQVYNQHTIMTSGAYDSVVNTIPVVRPGGGNHSIKLGNKQAGMGTEAISKTVVVSGSCISFWYALIFQNEHPNEPNAQPFFMFRVRDKNGNIIHTYEKIASYDTSFFDLYPNNVIYRDWTKYTYELGCEYEGDTVTLEFITADCMWSGHFGYAYIDDICFEDCMNCCETCDDMLNHINYFVSSPVLKYIGSTDSTCCYRFWPIFDPDLFACLPAGIKVYKDGDTSTVYSSYQNDSAISYWFNTSVLDFCLNRSQFTSPITVRIAFYNKDGEVICDTIKQTLQPCHSSSSGCNCNSLFDDENFANTSIIKKDTAASDEYDCCFTIEPFRDTSIIKCPYYGMRVYKDTVGGIGYAYLDSFKTGTPIGGPGADMGDTNKMKFCIGAYVFSSNGPQKLRIEYLDSTGKVICSKTETVNCEQSCCENVNVFVRKDTTETDPFKCCYRFEVWSFACNRTYTAELMRQTSTGWVNAGNDTFSLTRPIFFDVCSNNDDTARYMIFIKDSAGKILCTKEVVQTCPTCCKLVNYSATYVAPSPHLDRCCWDINVYPMATQECNIWNWAVYDSLHKVPSSYPPFMPPSGVYQGRHCTPIIHAPNPAPGTSVTIKYCIKRYLAVYDNNGNLLCIKPIELCCTRTYSNPHNPNGPLNIDIIPNPFNDVFTMSMDLPQAMPVAVNVVNSSGSTVFSNNYGPQPAGIFSTQINLAGLPAGTYTLSVNNGQATAQIVKQ